MLSQPFRMDQLYKWAGPCSLDPPTMLHLLQSHRRYQTLLIPSSSNTDVLSRPSASHKHTHTPDILWHLCEMHQANAK